MEANLDDLLQEALADFDDATIKSVTPVPAQAAPAAGSEQQAPVSTVTPLASSSAATKEESATSAAAPTAPKPAGPKGLGLGLGPAGADPLGRKGPRKAGGAASSTVTQPGEQPGPSGISAEAGKAAAALPSKPLNPEAQKLADDLLSLIQEAGLGGGPDDASALAGDLAGLLGGVGGAGAAGPGSSSGSTASGRGASGAAGPAGSADDDPLAKLFGRILGGMPPPGAAGGGADADAGPPPEFAVLLQQMMGAGGLGLGGEGGPEALGMGTAMGGMPAGAPPDLAALLGAAAAGADVRGAGPAGPSGRRPGAGGSAAGPMDEDDALASSRLAGLAQHTMKTVSKQAKATRGHVEGGGAAAAQGGGVAGGAGMGGLAQILQELGGLGAAAGGGGGEGGEGGGPPGGVNMMVDFIMQHLLSKDVLYGPLKEIRDRYPPWLEAHSGKLPAEEYGRYVAQYEAVQRVCEHYEKAPADYAKLMDLIQEMQTYGDPPGDIVEEMTGGAGRDLTTALANADADEGPSQPSLEELNGELNNCKMQ
ncbi:hypothetical protein HXX76_013523 [Chlamydomonas incerta]|uniref:Uncharacterized protein n=1 Tax=Chlamydomonas incerta TaxID=51695 RepID=A0A835VUI2_CHLIN|nr:hypothetical protein HXX76_013523 [Chlamydomonas incerta]|eukprot:KAG2425681.1 hypothetical protein HXX76_013523 [Chlamydomonas incerta]